MANAGCNPDLMIVVVCLIAARFYGDLQFELHGALVAGFWRVWCA
jgi:hypothetical protein